MFKAALFVVAALTGGYFRKVAALFRETKLASQDMVRRHRCLRRDAVNAGFAFELLAQTS